MFHPLFQPLFQPLLGSRTRSGEIKDSDLSFFYDFSFLFLNFILHVAASQTAPEEGGASASEGEKSRNCVKRIIPQQLGRNAQVSTNQIIRFAKRTFLQTKTQK